MQLKKFIKDDNASVVPIILFILTLVGCGGLYTLFFTEIALPGLGYMIPDSDSKTFIFMGVYAIPLFILMVGVFALLKNGLKRYSIGG